MCGRIAHEWPAYTPDRVAKLPYHYWRSLRALILRAYHPPSRKSGDADDDDVKVVDMDKLLGIGKQKG